MKISMFHLMPYRDLPDDFAQKYHSVWVDPPYAELADSVKVGQYYNWTLDELIHAADKGIDGICVNEHHQNAYGFMPNPDLMGSILARATNGTDVAVVQMGATLPTSNPPIRIAEEYSMIDCISGGRHGRRDAARDVAGREPLLRNPADRAARALLRGARSDSEGVDVAGDFRVERQVLQTADGQYMAASDSEAASAGLDSRQRQSLTWDFSAKHNHCYCFLSYWGNNFGKRVMDGFWDFVAKGDHDPNPYRAGFLQLVAVSETDAQAEKDYYKHIRYFYDKCLHILPEYFPVAGNQDYKSLVNSVTKLNPQLFDLMNKIPTWKYKDFVDNQFVIAGSPATVRQQLMEAVKKLRVGNLMVLLHIGSMPHELTIKNIDLFCSEVLPHFRGMWDGEWENNWWPESLKGPRTKIASNGVHAAAR